MTKSRCAFAATARDASSIALSLMSLSGVYRPIKSDVNARSDQRGSRGAKGQACWYAATASSKSR
jgi:hypothetical protein